MTLRGMLAASSAWSTTSPNLDDWANGPSQGQQYVTHARACQGPTNLSRGSRVHAIEAIKDHVGTHEKGHAEPSEHGSVACKRERTPLSHDTRRILLLCLVELYHSKSIIIFDADGHAQGPYRRQ